MDLLASLRTFLDASPCASFAADEMETRLHAAGFRPLDEGVSAWELSEGGWTIRRGASLVAFRKGPGAPKRFRVVGAHTDSPHLHLKPAAARTEGGYRQLSVEVYGGALWNSWLDRDLGLAGRIHSEAGETKRVRIHRPLARVPQLAIHLDRRVNEDGLKLNPQTQLQPIWGLAAEGSDALAALDELLVKEAGGLRGRIVSRDLSLYDLTPASTGGAENELLFSGRLDNLASCHAGLAAFLDDALADGRTDGTVAVLACFDHEEVGSASDTGAQGSWFTRCLERIALASGLDRSGFLAVLACSVLVSADMAHAAHPGAADRHDASHRPRLGGGPVLKSNGNQRYATTAETAALLRRLSVRAGVPLQDFVARNDVGCGSTIGPALASNLGIATVDVGQPMLSMHSARECAAVADHEPMVRLLREFWKADPET